MGADGVDSRDLSVPTDLELTMAHVAGSEETPAGRELGQLLRRARAGDLAAFEQILALHERRVFRTAMRLLQRTEDAEDAAQEVYLRLHRNLRRIDERRDLAHWLYRVTVNVCRDLNRRREKGRAVSFETISAGNPIAEPAATSAGPEEEAALVWPVSPVELEPAESRPSRPVGEGSRAAGPCRCFDGWPARRTTALLPGPKPHSLSHSQSFHGSECQPGGLTKALTPRRTRS